MCLPNFIEFKTIPKSNPLIGYRIWKNLIKDSNELRSESQDYIWTPSIKSHLVLDRDSGIYAYNNYNNNNNNNYNNNNYYYNNNYNYYNYYYIRGIIHQYGKVAIHKNGQRSQYAKIITLFSIRESDAKGPIEFLNWIKIFNKRVNDIALKYKCNVISFQDFIDSTVITKD